MKTTLHHIILTIGLLLSTLVSAQVYTIDNVPNIQLQDARKYVTNPNGILSTQTVSQLDAMLLNLKERTSVEFVVVILNSIGDANEREFANKLFEKWSIGQKANDNGLLFLFVLDKRKALTEVGYGLEGVLPDAINTRILLNYGLPYFRESNYDQGVLESVKAFIGVLSSDEAYKEVYTQPIRQQKGTNIDWAIIIYAYIALSVFIAFGMTLIVINSSWGMDNGAKYSSTEQHKQRIALMMVFFPLTLIPLYMWMNKRMQQLRYGKQVCEKCGGKMHLLTGEEADAILNAAQQTEKQIHSVEYDVWKCDQCSDVKIIAYPISSSQYTACPVCHTKAYGLKNDRVVTPATQFNKGAGEKIYSCMYCHYSKKFPYVIPMIAAAAAAAAAMAAGSRRRGGPPFGPFGGGGFSGGGGGFGGGRSGGGGGSVGW